MTIKSANLIKNATVAVTGEPVVGNDQYKTFSADIAGTGAVTATVIIEGSHDYGVATTPTWFTRITFTLSGTTTDSAVGTLEEAWPWVRASVSVAPTGTNATVNVWKGEQF